MKPRMLYFGPWDQAGHYFFDEHGQRVRDETIPFGRRHGWRVDGGLIPDKNYCDVGKAHITLEFGWTALSFWDMTVDSRPASHSTYLAEGTFTFDEMVAMAKERFALRWNQMKFEVVEVKAMAA